MIHWIYIIFAAFSALVLINNFRKSDSLQEEIMYGLVMLPFILRVLHLK